MYLRPYVSSYVRCSVVRQPTRPQISVAVPRRPSALNFDMIKRHGMGISPSRRSEASNVFARALNCFPCSPLKHLPHAVSYIGFDSVERSSGLGRGQQSWHQNHHRTRFSQAESWRDSRTSTCFHLIGSSRHEWVSAHLEQLLIVSVLVEASCGWWVEWLCVPCRPTEVCGFVTKEGSEGSFANTAQLWGSATR